MHPKSKCKTNCKSHI